ncbi:MAG TPA: hypothetical protein PKD86_04235 [Gemmatales bacterium]|nr:hypothetical protein [Gemmatales bacterium]
MSSEKGSELRPCPHCQQHCRTSETVCPHCGGAIPPGQPRSGPKLGRIMYGPARTQENAGSERESDSSEPPSGESREMYGPARFSPMDQEPAGSEGEDESGKPWRKPPTGEIRMMYGPAPYSPANFAAPPNSIVRVAVWLEIAVAILGLVWWYWR